MIIKRLDITSFGKFSGKVLEFSEGFNVIFGNNESGKSTVINFIFSMLYGFGDNRGKTISLREKYTPWSGGVCEGKMTVLTDDGKNICIYRKAGVAKKYDTLRVYDADTGEEYNKTPEEIAGIGQDTFFKTLCIRQLSSAFEGNNDEIIHKLSNISTGADEAVSYEKAQKILDGIRREIQPQRGQGGELSKITRQLAEQEKAYAERKNAESELKTVESLISQAENELMALESKKKCLENEDTTLEIARLQGRLEERKNYSSGNRNLPFFAGGILCFILFAVTVFFNSGLSFIFLLASLLLFAGGFIKSKSEPKNSFMEIEEELKTLIEKKEKHDNEIDSIVRAVNEAEKKIKTLKIRKESLSIAFINDDSSPEILIKEKKKLETNLRIVTTTMEALEKAHDNMQKNFTPSLNKKASVYFNHISDGRYSRIFCDKEFGAMIETDIPRESGFFSGGTIDQLYLSVRLALIDMLYADKSCPILLDQPFLQYDSDRKARATDLLSALPSNRQIILFTSDKRLNSTNKETEMLT